MAINTVRLTITKHAVETCTSGLSPLQEQLLDDTTKIRIVDAPTGAGKTYAFQKGLVQQQQRILFIVPTRRLAQNIAGGLINDLVEQEGWSELLATNKVAVWSSDQTAQLNKEGVENIRGYRVRQLSALKATQPEGEMIIATPEVVSYLLLDRRLDLGHASMGVFDVLTQFDHIVFDEFHTIESRGFGLAALFAKLTPHFGRAKISFLSATPINIKPVLLKLGVEEKDIKILKETLVKTGRYLHGDVILTLVEGQSMRTLINSQKECIAHEVKNNRQIVIIYNALSELRRDLTVLSQWFSEIGIDSNQILAINSIDDSGGNYIMSCGIHTGQHRNPDDYSILIATASVEMGVTFRNANTMFMEPGFEPLNFLQRYGRAARRGQDGQVWVCLDSDVIKRNHWVRALQDWAYQNKNSHQSIQTLISVMSSSILVNDDQDENYFGQLGRHAEYSAGLYWQVLMRHPSNKKYRGEHLRKHQPNSSRHIYALLKTIHEFEKIEDYKESCEVWLKHLYAQALRYRDIGKRVKVIEEQGRILYISRLWLERETNILQAPHCLQEDENGNEVYEIRGELDDYLLDKKNHAERQLEAYFPHRPDSEILTAGNELASQWCKILMDKRNQDSEFALEDCPKSMRAAEKIVYLTGLVPSDECTLSDAIITAII